MIGATPADFATALKSLGDAGTRGVYHYVATYISLYQGVREIGVPHSNITCFWKDGNGVSVPISPLDLVEESSHEVPTTFLVDT